MASETEREVYRAHRDAQSRYANYLLSAAAACIAFAVSQTQSTHLAWWLWPAGGAVLCWGASFYCGCQHLMNASSGLHANVTLLQVRSGTHPDAGNHPQAIAIADEVLRKVLAWHMDQANRYGHWQFRFLVAGGALFLVWHVMRMYRA